MQSYERGWHAISLYTGVPAAEIQAAVAAGEVRCKTTADPKISHLRMDAWLLARQFGPQLVDHYVDLPADVEQSAEWSAFDLWQRQQRAKRRGVPEIA